MLDCFPLLREEEEIFELEGDEVEETNPGDEDDSCFELLLRILLLMVLDRHRLISLLFEEEERLDFSESEECFLLFVVLFDALRVLEFELFKVVESGMRDLMEFLSKAGDKMFSMENFSLA
jgi:hypothetical protein